MPLGPFGEVVGTTGTLESLGPDAQNYKSKVIAPRNPKLRKSDDAEHKMTPSKFLFDMQMNTDQKLANTHTMRMPKKIDLLDMADTSLQKFSQVNIDEPMFQPFPSEIVFLNFNPYEVYEVPLVLRNNDKVPRLVKVTQADSPYFKIISPHDVGNKVGPGLPTTFKLQFYPDEKKDYNHELVCITEREKFIVPVKAIGARAILDFPDEVNLPSGPVKYTQSKTLLVRNIGNREAKFTLSVDKPFSVQPEIGTLAVQDSMQVTVEFCPQKSGDYKTDLVLHYDTGEDILIGLYGVANDANVRLDKNSIKIESTFLSMANQRRVQIHNRTDVICHFRWTQFATQEEEDHQKLRVKTALLAEEKSDTDQFLQDCIQDPTLRDKLSVLQRTFQNRIKMVEADGMLFNDEVVKIEPVEGDIWPNSSFEVNVIFKPREAKTYTRTAYCDITGRESRLPLRIKGDGIGPKVQFSYETLDMGNVFIGSKHTYEVVLANKGDIDAIYTVMPKASIFGPCFQFNPAEGIVMPGGHQAIQIVFSSPYLGDFEEEFSFQVDGQPETLSLTFSGSVIGPTFEFDVPKLRFGNVSYGFLHTQTCFLRNTSLVPMTFHLRVPGDGITESICGTSDLDSNRSEMGSPTPVVGAGPPKEFEIVPQHGTLKPQSSAKITVNLISNTIKKYEMALVVDVENVGEEILSLPITAKCIVPAITVLSPILDYGRCFLRHPYEHSVKLHNDSDLPAKYELLTQQVNQDTPITYKSPQPKGIVEPHSVCDVTILIEAQKLEEQDIAAYFSIFGSPDPPLPVHIACIGEGPVVHIVPLQLDWGVIPVLNDTPKNVLLSNESLIPAKFTAHMVRPNSAFRVEPEEGEIPPEKTMQLTITANLNDCVRFQDKLQINVIESSIRQIPLMGYGVGTTITSEPALTPMLDLGPNFSNRPLKKSFILTNKGRRHQQLVWSTDGFSPINKAKKEMLAYNPLDMKFKNVPPPGEPARPIFKLNPNRYDLPPGASIEMLIEGLVDCPQFVKERLLCHAIIGKQGGKELIMKVDVSADFISPLLEFSTKSVYFRVDKKPEDTLTLQTRELKMMNVSTLPLTTGLKLQPPFQIILSDGSETSETEVHLGVGQEYTLRIQFDPAYKDDLHIRTVDEVLHIAYKEHPHIDYVALRGEVYFPNLEMEKSVVDFGCILNDTEVTRYVNITNNSPMEVKYRWSFLIGDEPCTVINRPIQKPKVLLQEIREESPSPPPQPQPQVEVIIEEAKDDKEEGEVEKGEVESTKEEEPVIESEEIVKEPEQDIQPPEGDNRTIEDQPSSPQGSPRELEEQPEKGQLEQEEPPEGGKEKDEELTAELGLCLKSVTDAEHDDDPLKTNRALSALLELDRDTPIGVEEVFDILPLYGILMPGDTEQVTMTFYGHADIWGQAKAICEVEGGPTYEIMLKGEASLVSYTFDTKEINYGKQMYDHVASEEITLINNGKVGFEFSCIGMDPSMIKRPKPGVPIMVPSSGYIEPMSEQKLTVKYLPGIPEVFTKTFNIQVAHFEPDKITLNGEGVFPRVSLDLPRNSDPEGYYNDLVKRAKENVFKTARTPKITERPQSGLMPSSQRMDHLLAQGEICTQPPELDVQLEVERLTIQEFADELQKVQSSQLNLYEPTPPNSNESRETQATTDSKQLTRKTKRLKPKLPEYLLDFGYVVLGTVRTHIVRATNTGWFPVSFQVEREDVHHYGFHVELDKVRNLPGAPDHETVDFIISFDPRGANLELGPVEALVPINIVNGPIIMIRLHANVTMPDMEISDDTLDFADVKCGECKVITVQLHNQQQVKCEWNSLPTDKDKKRMDKHVPMHLRRKMKNEKLKPRHFEIMPPTGTLLPGQRLNVQVKFMPTEERYYEQRIPIRIAQSSQRILLLCRGQGLEPRLEFDRNLVEFGPILPHSSGDEQEIVVKNPCGFPIEFYNLEFDTNYLEEEKVLRLMKGYDEYNTILLPPRPPGEKLPPELLEYYEEQMKKLEEAEAAKRAAEELAEAARREQEEREGTESGEGDGETARDLDSEVKTDAALGTIGASQRGSIGDALVEPLDEEKLRKDDIDAEESSSSIRVGELEITPVSAAIARHLGIDLTPEGKAARNRRGICIIVHGAPMAGKTATAVQLARKYEAALLTVDQVVVDAISNGNTPSGLKAREMCAEAARKRLEELRLMEGTEEGESKRPGGLSVEAVTAHTQGTTSISAVPQAAPSVISNRKTSTVSDIKGKDKHSLAGTKTGVNTSSVDGATGSQDSVQKQDSLQKPDSLQISQTQTTLSTKKRQVPSSPPPLAAPIARRLSVSASVAGEEGLMSCVLPEDLLVEILSERLQLNDCHRGVVFDGLETLFAQNLYTTAHAILRCLNNRRFIYFMTLKLDYSVLKEQEKKAQEEREKLALLKEEEDRQKLEEMSEDEYDALPDVEKAEVDKKRLEIKKERIRKENEERQERERREMEVKLEEQRRLEEEKMSKKKGGKKGAKEEPVKDGKKSVAPGKPGTSQERVQKSQGGPKSHDSDHPVKVGSAMERPESHATEKSDTQLEDGKKGKKGKDGKKDEKGKEKGDKNKDGSEPADEPVKEPLKESDIILMQRFRTFEHAQKDINEMIEWWDRTTLSIKRPPTPSERSDEDHNHPPSGKKGKGKGDKHDKEKEKEKQKQKEDAERAAKEAAAALQGDGEDGDNPEGDGQKEKDDDGIGIPNIFVDCTDKSIPAVDKIMDTGRLPTMEEVLDGLGLGPKGPPIPPAANFSVVPYPVKRRAPPVCEFGGRYIFVASSPDDPNIGIVETKEPDAEEEKSVTPDKGKDDHTTPTKKGGKADKKEAKEDKKGERKKSAERKGTSSKTATSRRNSMQVPSPTPGHASPVSDGDAFSNAIGTASNLQVLLQKAQAEVNVTEGSNTTGEGLALSEAKTLKLSIFRWTIPANGEVLLRLRFQSEELGQFDQTLNFEIVGTRRRYQLYCRGICAFPSISREPRIVFPSRKKNKGTDEIVHKKYILTTETFEFGPLLFSKNRDKYKEGRYPENMETLTIMNTSPLEADISFCYREDSKGETFLLEPPSMVLKSGESQPLTIWAYPKVPGHYQDEIVCCIRENPEPVVFKICCDAFKPELDLDKREFRFQDVLLHRKDTKTIFMKNNTQLPVRWKLSGLDNLGDDFTVASDSGIVEPNSEYKLHAYFRAMKPVQQNKKNLRLEISDVDYIHGTVHVEPIIVFTEAYDVMLDMSFPKGTDGGLDFGTVRVSAEEKQQCSLKNKGKHEIEYNFVFENCDPSNPNVTSLFSVIPREGKLNSADRPTNIQVIFKSQKEVYIKEQPILKCQVIVATPGEEREIIASIPVKVSVKAVFSKFQISPTDDINFGSILVNNRKQGQFIIENTGEFDFRYQITRMVKESQQQQQQARQTRPPVKDSKRTKSRDGSSSGRSVAKPKKTDSVSEHHSNVSHVALDSRTSRTQNATALNRRIIFGFGYGGYRDRQEGGIGQSRLQLGAFTIQPAFNIIPAHNQQIINVDCVAEQEERFDEELSIDITDREPTVCPGGIPYRLLAEGCIPSINTENISSIFEEHRICKNLSIWQHSNQFQMGNDGGVYGEDENRFIFNNVIVGRRAKARFKISNTNKVPCDVVFSIKPVVVKGQAKHQDIFEVEPVRAEIANHSHVYATVTFVPPSMQNFSAIFEAAIDGLPPSQTRGRTLTFEVAGEGNLPRINIQKPTVRNKRGQPLLLFKKNLIGHTECLPLILVNDGTLPSKVDIDIIDPDKVFKIRPTGDTKADMGDEDDNEATKKPHTASVVVSVGETATFSVLYKPMAAQRSQAHIRLSVIDNQYEDSIIQLVGEGYEDEISLDNIHSVDVPIDPETEEGNMAEDDVAAAKPNLIRFGDCYINEPRTLSLSISNHSKTDCVRFQWPDHPQLKFSPTVGHLHPGVTKDMTVTFKFDQPKQLTESPVSCKVTKITFDKPAGQIADWDDRIRTVKWVDVPTSPHTTEGSSKPPVSSRPNKKKIVETEPEPAFTEVPESSRNLELLVSGTADFCKYKCKTESVHFKDTLMFQTRIFEFTISNKGTIQMEYSWQVVLENFVPSLQRAVTFMSEAERPESRIDLGDASYIPFSIEPEFGSILPGKKAHFTVKFSPLDVNEYEGRLICTMPNLEKNQQGPVIGVKGKSLMPYCHFELQDSDYISSAKRNPEMRGPGGAPPGSTLDPNTRVIEYNCIGIGVKNTKTFAIVNPTSHSYSFEWVCEDDNDPKNIVSFDCLTPKGQVRSGKKYMITFEYTSHELDIVESFWKFVIPEQNIEVPFLMVGHAREPDISLDRSHMNFKALLIGHEAIETVYLMNNEEEPFHFAFEEDSCHSAGYSAHLKVHPMNGVLPPKSRMQVDLHFIPNSDKEVNFNLVCKVKRKKFPVTLNVKAEGYSMDCTLLCEDSQGNQKEFITNGLNIIRFGEVEVNEEQIRNLFIMNSGKFNFDYKWEINMGNRRSDMVNISPSGGGVMCGDKQKCILSFCPPKRTTLKDSELVLKISHGPTFHIALEGLGVTPGLHFSFQSYNFGNCFIYRAGMPAEKKVLKLTNKDKKEISVDCLYTPTNHLHHDFEACVIPPGHSKDITFTFYPREAKKYNEVVPFEINGLSTHSININGIGTEMKIEVADPKHKCVNLGSRVVNDVIKKYIPIVNNSPAPITFNMSMTTPVALQQPGILSISPTNQITLEPKGGTCKVEVVFAPKTRIPPFKAEVVMEWEGLYQTLFIIQGSCLGMDITLDTFAIPFGPVMKDSQKTRKIVMSNTGDINAKFKWDIKRFQPDFSIHPVEGFITTDMDVTFDVIFAPKEINDDIRYDNLRCFLEGGPHKPVTLTLTGICKPVPAPKDAQHFSTSVRSSETKNLYIANKTSQHWQLKPIIEADWWIGPVTFTVEPQQTKPYPVTYRPLEMTQEGKKHTGTIFFPLPDGTGLLYNLIGVAEAPKPSGKVQRDVPCKIPYTELLPIENWLKKPQRFKVKHELIKPDKFDPGTKVTGLDYIDVPASGKKDYKLTFYAHKEGTTTLKETFINEQTMEYQYFEVTFKATRPGTIKTMDLTTPVRQCLPCTISLENPLSNAVMFNVSCSGTNTQEILMPNQLNVPAQSQGQLTFDFLPVKVGESQARIELNSTELGLYIYDLNLKATPSGPEKALYFRTCLGQSQVQVAKFKNFSKAGKADYSCKVDNSDFHVDKTLAAAPGSTGGTEVSTDITFEPSRLGEQKGILTISSPQGGDFFFPLFGTCVPPKPQGPYIIKAGTTTSITFRNTFTNTTPFTFQVDNPLFHLTKQSENIRARKDHRIGVGFDGTDSGSKSTVMGKLIVTCPRSAGGNSNVQWVYYLKGVSQ